MSISLQCRIRATASPSPFSTAHSKFESQMPRDDGLRGCTSCWRASGWFAEAGPLQHQVQLLRNTFQFCWILVCRQAGEWWHSTGKNTRWRFRVTCPQEGETKKGTSWGQRQRALTHRVGFRQDLGDSQGPGVSLCLKHTSIKNIYIWE